MNKEARTIFNTIQALFTTNHQLQTFHALIAEFLKADGNPRPEHAPVKSSSAFSRFLNVYDWNARSIIRAFRTAILTQIWATYARASLERPCCQGFKPEHKLSKYTLEIRFVRVVPKGVTEVARQPVKPRVKGAGNSRGFGILTSFARATQDTQNLVNFYTRGNEMIEFLKSDKLRVF